MSFPIHDWQFWIATLAAVVAAAYLIRRVLPRRKRRSKGHRAVLTLEGKPVDRPRG